MSDDTDRIKAEVTRILTTAGVTFAAKYRGPTVRDPNTEQAWECDEWTVEFKRGTKLFATPYYMGIGHRKPRPGAPQAKGNPRTRYRENWEKQWLVPTAPTAEEVLHSLLLDAEANSMSFPEWCSQFGYSDDSLKAFDTYRVCCEMAENLRFIFTAPELVALHEAVEGL